MRIFLASTFNGMNKADRETFIKIGKPKYILETFFAGKAKCESALKDAGIENFLLDSGAFSFMSGAECSKKTIEGYAEQYIDFIKSHQIPYYFELDVDTIFGIDFVETIRKKLERETGRQCIPVWHKGRGVEYWKRMCDEYSYIAIGGLVFHVMPKEYGAIQRLVDYACARGVRVHGLGFTKTKMLGAYRFYSVDSASFTKGAALGQQRHDFTGYSIKAHKVNGRGKKINLSKLILQTQC